MLLVYSNTVAWAEVRLVMPGSKDICLYYISNYHSPITTGSLVDMNMKIHFGETILIHHSVQAILK